MFLTAGADGLTGLWKHGTIKRNVEFTIEIKERIEFLSSAKLRSRYEFRIGKLSIPLSLVSVSLQKYIA